MPPSGDQNPGSSPAGEQRHPEPHRKTRMGCTQCKRRRVKCDEGKPCCANCIRNALTCSLEFLTPAISRPPHTLVRTSGPHYQTLLSPSPNQDSNLKPHTLDPRRQELLHHYITAAVSQSFGPDRAPNIWREAIPRMALTHEFLMQGMLAASALRLAYLQPHRKDELIKFAIRSEHLALPNYRKHIAENKQDTVHAVFAFAGFVVSYMTVTSKVMGELRQIPAVGSNTHWFFALRGAVALLVANYGILKAGPFGPVLNRTKYLVEFSINPEDKYFAKVHEYITEPEAEEDEPDIKVCREALEELRRVSALPFSPCKTVSNQAALYIWPGSIPQAYIELLRKRRPEALVVLAYYCVLLKKFHSHMWFESVGVEMLEAIRAELDERWLPYIEWPLQQPCW